MQFMIHRNLEGGGSGGVGSVSLVLVLLWTLGGCGSEDGAGSPTDPDGTTPGFGYEVLSAGSFHTCGVADGTLYCWGDNEAGQAGHGTEDDAFGPTPVAGDQEYGAVAGGSFHTCASTTAGNAYCWGQNGSGELGDGSTEPRPEPAPVTDGLGLAQVAAGGSHSCGVRSAGQAFCWGDNFAGQLGDGTDEPTRTTPVAVTGDLLFSSISAGSGSETCAISTDGEAYCWGTLPGTTYRTSTPVAVQGESSFSLISVGDRSVCGLSVEGLAYCWGANGAGQLGDGSKETSGSPVAVSGDLEFTDLDVGARHACGVAADEEVYCWGDNSEGQLGVAEEGGSSTTPIPVAGDVRFSAVAAGDGHTCALDTGGAAYCWGRNSDGQLGDGSTEPRLEPTPVVEPE